MCSKSRLLRLLFCFIDILLVQWVLSGEINELSTLQTSLFSGVKDFVKGDNFVTPETIRFYLFTEENTFSEINRSNLTQLVQENARIVFLIHGWLETRDVEWYEQLKNLLLNKKEENFVVQVDWSAFSKLNYVVSWYYSESIGKVIGSFVIDLHEKYFVKLSEVLIIGHSLGGQIAGFAAKEVKKVTGRRLFLLVALDPAGPLFTNSPDEGRLNSNDAEVVYVIHTNGGNFGYYTSCGTIDFFPNGGIKQPGCNSVDMFDIRSISRRVSCDHQRSWKYFIEAVSNPMGFIATKCDSWSDYKRGLCKNNINVLMGDLLTNKTGKFYLETNENAPYAKTL